MKFEEECVIMNLYIENAKSFIQLSTGALVLSITFLEKVLGETGHVHPNLLLVTGWVCFLLTIMSGALYQHLAVKYLDQLTDEPGNKGPFPQYLIDNPGVIYGLMLLAFFVGAGSLVFFAIHRMYV